jgi:hypothetical protein
MMAREVAETFESTVAMTEFPEDAESIVLVLRSDLLPW